MRLEMEIRAAPFISARWPLGKNKGISRLREWDSIPKKTIADEIRPTMLALMENTTAA
jgi:hypothetical protein